MKKGSLENAIDEVQVEEGQEQERDEVTGLEADLRETRVRLAGSLNAAEANYTPTGETSNEGGRACASCCSASERRARARRAQEELGASMMLVRVSN